MNIHQATTSYEKCVASSIPLDRHALSFKHKQLALGLFPSSYTGELKSLDYSGTQPIEPLFLTWATPWRNWPSGSFTQCLIMA